ncbi:MAG: leucine-rich repeat protein [Ruminococcus callidus]|nr:leucine-rich repeat protein [Ruminococcus callidus]
MGFLRKMAAAAVAGVLCLAGNGTLPQAVLLPQEHVFAASGETVSETKYYEESGTVDSSYYGDFSWSSSIGYVILTESHWDDNVGNVVSNSHIRITSVSIQTRSVEYTTTVATYERQWYASDSDIPVVGASYVDASSVVVEIPDTIDDIPVTEIGDMTVSYSSWGSGYGFSWGTPRLLIPSTLSSIGDIRCSSKYDSVQIEYDGTCEQFLSQCEVHTDTPVVCTDGSFYCTNGSYYSSCDYITYSGTCAEWKAFCPAYLSDTMVKCSDGTVNPPLPTDKQYRYDRATQTATYLGGDDDTITYLNLPTAVEGYTVTAIADSVCSGYSKLYSLALPSKLQTIGDEAFLNCKSLREIYIPSSVTSIGSHAFGFWKNSDGTYSRMNTVTIYCTEGSAAQEYAQENDLSYVLISDEAFSSTTTITTMTTTTTTTTTTSETYPTEPPATTDTTTRETYYPTELPVTTTTTTRETYPTEPPATTTTTTTAVSKIFITPPDKSLLHVGEEFPLFSTVLSDDVIWYSTNENVATVRINNDIVNPGSGLVKIVGTGTVTIVLVYGDRIGSVTFEVPADTGTSEKTVLGDVNLDGRIDITDAVLLNKTCAGVVSLTDAAKKNADCDYDGEVGSNDAVSLMRFLVHLISTLPE